MENDAVQAFENYMLKQSRRETAFAQYNHAAAALEVAQIRERLAELLSQTQPIESLLEQPMSERLRLYAAAHYVVTGRLPKG